MATINLSQSQYANTVNVLSNKIEALENCKAEYQQQRNSIPNFWTGEAAKQAERTIDAAIEKVEQAQEGLRKNMDEFQRQQKAFDEQEKAALQALEQAESKINNLFT